MKYIGGRDEAESILKEGNIGCLGMFSDAYPYLVPLCYIYYKDCIYFHSGTKGQKLNNIRNNNRVCFQVDKVLGLRQSNSPCKYGINYRSVIVFGQAVEVADSEEKITVLNYLTEAFSKGNTVEPLNQKEIDSVIVIKIIVDEMTVKINEA